MTQAISEVKLRVGELTERVDYGRGVVRISATDMKRIGVNEGDVIEIEGERKTVAIAVRAYPADVGLDVVRMDGLMRRNAKASIGDQVKIRRADIKEAKSIVIAPTRKGIIIRMSGELMKRNILMRPFVTGDIMIPNPVVKSRRESLFDDLFQMDLDNFMFAPFGEEKFIVVSTDPKGPVRITRNTEAELMPQATAVMEEKIPEVTYEDLGGLHEEVKMVREMIELPLKHPELFERLGIEPPKGVLLHGPPGTGKTLLAKAVANESGARFFVINGPEVMCVDSDTDIRTNEGTLKARELYSKIKLNGRVTEKNEKMEVVKPNKEFFVECLDDNKKLTLDKIDHAFTFKTSIYRVKIGNDIEVRGSQNQPLLVKQGEQLVWKKIKELEGNEIVAKMNGEEIEFDQITSIENIGEGDVYDFAVNPYSNFIGGNPAVLPLHNSKFYGESEENLRKLFEQAEKSSPSIVFIDEIDAIAPKREEVRGEVEKRVVSQLLTLLDGLKSRGRVVVIGATNIPNAIDPALRRPGRLDREIVIGVPDAKGRKEILQIHTRGMPLDRGVDLGKIAEVTYGYVGADITALTKEAAMHAVRRILPDISLIKEDKPLPDDMLKKLIVTEEDFSYALKMVQPSGMREVMIEIPNVKWKDIGGLEHVKQLLIEAVEWPLKNPESFKRMGIRPPKGIMIYGPPGCGKTLLAKAVASESSANFIYVKAAELLSMWVGESEKHVREVFKRAKQVAPSIIFFDEIDAMAPKRGSSQDSHVTERVVSQMLAEMSGLEDTADVVVLAATNRPDILDNALLRPGRFDRHIFVPTPDNDARLKILQIHTKNMPLSGVNIEEIASSTDRYSGADIEALCREAAMHALRINTKANKITMDDFEDALAHVKPSVSDEMNAAYQKALEKKREQTVEDDIEYIR